MEALRGFCTHCAASALLVCAWGELGASACFGGDINSLTVLSCPALSGISVVDSLGAGDSFVAGLIYTLVQSGFTPDSHLRGKDQAEVVEKAVSFGCRVAGLKCTIFGYDGIRELVHSTESATN
ncbi:ketohexokinase [Plakobranchus ocellatus]|uniref:Ketohexokinase n=1 Tax=Plakobranchus ocellatus TaxID=259542 RepID=A0AAV4A328_9GAST|nr:ketohexokinase [Plakobranchus ocellatus]